MITVSSSLVRGDNKAEGVEFLEAMAASLIRFWVEASSFRYLSRCHIHKIALSATPDLRSHIHQLQSTFTQLAVRTFRTSVYILLYYVPCTFDPSGLDSLLGFHHSYVQLQTQLQLYFSSISAFVCIEYNPNSVSIYKLDVFCT